MTLVYVILMLLCAATVDESSPTNEIMFMFVLPIVLLTVAFIRIAYKTGEKPEWRWGNKKE